MRTHRLIAEAGGSVGDLGTFLPHVIGAMTVAGLAPPGVLFGFGVSLIGSGLFYGLPIAVQPMKAVSAVMLTGQLGAGEVAATGLIMGVLFLILAVTGSIVRLSKLIPQSVTAGLQLGLGISMAVLGIRLMLDTPWLGGLALVILVGLMRVRQLPAALIAIIAVILIGYAAGEVVPPPAIGFALALPAPVCRHGLRWFGPLKSASSRNCR